MPSFELDIADIMPLIIDCQKNFDIVTPTSNSVCSFKRTSASIPGLASVLYFFTSPQKFLLAQINNNEKKEKSIDFKKYICIILSLV